MQKELHLIGMLHAPSPLLQHQLLSFGDEEETAVKKAIQWAWMNRRIKSMDKRTAAMHTGIPAPHFSNIVNGKKHLPPHKINAYEWVMGNKAVSMTIERFRVIREEEQALVVAREIVRSRQQGQSAA